MSGNIRLLSEGFEQAARNFDGSVEDLKRNSSFTVESLQGIGNTFAEHVDKFAKSVQLLAAISGMNAENKQRENLGHSVAYGEEAFDSIVKEYS